MPWHAGLLGLYLCHSSSAIESSASSIAPISLDKSSSEVALPQVSTVVGRYRVTEQLGILGGAGGDVHPVDFAYHSATAPLLEWDAWDTLIQLQLEAPQPHPMLAPPPSYDYSSSDRLLLKGTWRLRGLFAGGSHGEVWRGRRLLENEKAGGHKGSPGVTEHKSYILKRMTIEKGEYILKAGLREIYFGDLLISYGGHPHIARFVEHFFRHGRQQDDGLDYCPNSQYYDTHDELWLVFEDEGRSLRDYLYTKHSARGYTVCGRSKFWRNLRESPELFKEMLRQLLESLLWLHSAGIVHRDVKPSNIIMRVEDSGQGIQPHLRLADFSSAVDADSFARLYGQEGPTKDESTLDYAPPEVLFSSRPYEMSRPSSYDLWSVGVMILEMLFGTPEVFTVSQRSRAVLERELSRRSGASSWRSNSADADSDSFEDFEVQDKAEAFLLASFADLCIYMPGIHGPSSFSSPGESVLVSWSSVRDKGDEAFVPVEGACSSDDLKRALQARDPLAEGLEDEWGIDLLRRLLMWDPLQRISAEEALAHAYFTGPYKSYDGVLHATREDALKHEVSSSSGSPGLFLVEEGVSMVQKHTLQHIKFQCACGRVFDSWDGCQHHTRARKHGLFCSYDSSTLPPCISSHRMLPFDPHSGWCDLQGRRRRIEDFTSLVYLEDYKFYGVFDGHNGAQAAKYSSRILPLNIDAALTDLTGFSGDFEDMGKLKTSLLQAFEKTHEDFLRIAGRSEPPDESGATATVALVYPQEVIIAHVGDSRAVLCCLPDGSAWELTEDHNPYVAEEAHRVMSAGGFVSHAVGDVGIKRVNGQLSVTRALGDRSLAGYLSREPDVIRIRINPSSGYRFLILASDGLWDEVDPQEAVEIVNEVISNFSSGQQAMQVSATRLAHEAYLRGSADNIGVLTVTL